MAESVPSVLESEARGEVADIYADIRKVLGTSVVNLIWRNLATMPGALLLGRIFSLWNLVAYGVGIAFGVWVDGLVGWAKAR